jgi:flagellar hook-basal body complex protein FliE
MVKSGLEQVSGTEQNADDLVQKMATGQPVQPHEVMIASSKASLSVEMLAQVRNKALDAYREVMSLQI